MNKLIICVMIFSLLLLTSVSAGEVIYIYKTTQYIEQSYIDVIEDLGHNVNTVSYTNVNGVNFDDYDMILVGDGVYSNAASFPVNDHNTLIANSWDSNLRNWGWSDYVSSLAASAPLDAININLDHRITENLNRDIQIYTSAEFGTGINIPVYYLSRFDRALGMDVITSTNSPINDPSNLDTIIATTEPGRTLRLITNSGARITTQSNARGAYFGIVHGDYWTNDARELFSNTVEWLISGVDGDEDGWFSDDDCDDTDPLINPGADEIPYNDIDEDCNGFDLGDVDGDGYCDSGFNIADAAIQCPNEAGSLGSDCNDNEALENPGSLDPELDCVNEAPELILNIEDLELNEDDSKDLDLSLYFSDVDGDSLTYIVSGNSNIQVSFNGDTATITPDGDWNGDEDLIIAASDGSLSVDSNQFNVLVNPVNDLPDLSLIDDLTVVAGDLVVISTSATDVDGDSLTYTFTTPLDENGEWQTTLDDVGSYTVTVSVTDGSGEDSQDINIYVISKLIINEFTVDPQQDWDGSGSITGSDEWFEIYNPHVDFVGLSGWELHLIDSGDTNVESLDSYATILGSSYLVIQNPVGDQNLNGRLELYNNGVLVDSISYGNHDDGDILDNAVDGNANDLTDECLARDPNAQDTDQDNLDWVKKACTQGINNQINVLAPIVTLVSPDDNEILNVNDVSLSYSVTDNDASSLECNVYADISGTFEIVGSQEVEQGGSSLFVLNDVAQGTYRWNVECSDSVNSAFALEDFSFTVDTPDAPVLDFIADIIVDEGALIIITPTATDLDGDVLDFSINDPSSNFVEDNDVFSWQTGFGDEGTYTVTITVSDGSLEDSQEVQIFVGNVNLPPTLDNNIPDQSLNEDDSKDLDLSLYFSELDGESLTYIVSGNSNIQVSFNGDTATITPDGDWNGDEDLIITASDGSLSTDSNQFNVLVNPMPDAPTSSNIPDQNVNEDEDLLNAFNLNNYFDDVDGDLLAYSVNGNSNIQVIINPDGSVDIIPNAEFSGSETVIFTADDGTSTVDSNDVLINVIEVNDLPVFDSIPDQTILEDSGFNGPINLVFSDSDGTVEVSVLNENEVDCEVLGSELSLVPSNNYFGDTTCTLRATDNEGGFVDRFVNIEVVNVNDAPEITSFSPNSNPVISDVGTQLFRITRDDIDNLDSELRTEWRVDGVVWSITNDFIFRTSNYAPVSGSQVFNIEVIVSDLDTSVSRTWQLTVDETVQIQTCSEQSGDICSGTETCSGNWLSASDSPYCCSVTCTAGSNPPEEPPAETPFNITELDISCENGDIGDLKLKIKEPDDGDDFKIKDLIDVEAKVDNDGEEDLDVVVEAILYDLDSEEEIDNDEQEEEIDDGSDEDFNLELEVENEDVNEDHDFIVFVKAYEDNNEEGQCVQDFVDVDIEREKHEIIIDNLKVNPDSAECGDLLKFNLDIENIGEKDEEEVYVKIRNNKLNINEKGSLFDLDNEDSYNEKIYVTLPEDLEDNSYTFLVEVFYDDKVSSEEINVIIKCGEEYIKTNGVIRTTSAKKGFSNLNLDVKTSPLVRARTCEVIDIPVSVFNPSDSLKSYEISLMNIDSWASSVGSKGLFVGGKQSGKVTFTPEIRGDASLGKHSGLVNVKEDGKLIKSEVLDVDINKGMCKEESEFELGNLWLIAGIIILIILIILSLAWIFKR